jgi:RTX calcium-binding nonapeptide repeat (4 copies)
MTINGTAGNDTLVGTAGDDVFAVEQGGEDNVSGLGGNDVFHFVASFDAGDTVDGGTGTDTLLLRGDYSAGVVFGATTLVNVEKIDLGAGFNYNLTTNDATVASGATLFVDAARISADNSLTFDGSAETDGRFIIEGGAGDDHLTGGAGNDIFRLEHGGDDTANGGDGDDIFVMGAALTANDQIDGGLDRGEGHNTLRLNGDYSAGLTLGPDTIQDIQNIQFDPGHSYSITTDDNNFLSGPTIVVNGGALGASDNLTFDAGAEGDANFRFIGGAGDNTLTGGASADYFDLTRGGFNIVSGGGLGDTFNMGSFFTPGDQIDGGSGNDIVELDGLGIADGFVFNANTMVNVENLVLLGGHSYNMTTNDATVAAGETLVVNAVRLGASDRLTFNGLSETDGSFDFRLGAHLTASDTIAGGAGNDSLTLNGDYSSQLVFNAGTMSGIETLNLVGDHSYDLKLNTANVAHNGTLTVDASTLGATDSLTFDASQLAFLTLDITAGAGNDVITGPFSATFTLDLSLGGDDTVHSESGGVGTFLMGGALTAADKIDGGGSGSIVLDGDYTGANAVVFNATTITNMENLTVDGGHSYDLTANAATLGTHQLRVYATGLQAGDTLTFDGSATITGVYQFNAGAGSYSLTGGSLNDQFNMGASFTASDHVDGGAGGADALDLDGDYSGGLVFGAATMVNIQVLQLTGGHSYNLTTNDATVASGATLTVEANSLGAGDTMIFDASAETNGFFAITGGAGNDTVTLTNASVFAGSTIDGGGGNDTVILNGDFSTGIAFSPGTITNVGTLQLDAGHDYILTTDDGNVASGATLTVDASALGAGNSLDFAGSAETDGSFAFIGGAGDDSLTGGANDDTFDLTHVTSVVASGEGGNNTFTFAGNFTAADQVDGGDGADTVILDGDYSAGLTFTPTTMTNVEYLVLGAGHDYKFTTDDATVASGSTLTINAAALGTGHTISFDGSAETDGDFVLTAGASFTAADTFIGSADNDVLILNGDYSAGLTFGAATLQSVENIELGDAGGSSYNLTTNDANVGVDDRLTVDASDLTTGSLTFDGSAETDGFFTILGGAANDIITGGAFSDIITLTGNTVNGDDTVTGGGGADVITASDNAADSDTFIYHAVYDSTSTVFDTIKNFNFDKDDIAIGGFASPITAIDTAVTSGSLSLATFDADLAAAVGAGQLGAHHAVLFTPNAGGFAGDTFLIVDTNGSAGYQASQDLVIELVNSSGTLTTADF